MWISTELLTRRGVSMDLLIEFLGELVFEGIFEVIKSPKVPRCIRYFLFIFVSLFYIGIIGLFLFFAITSFQDKAFLISVLAFLFSLLIAIFYGVFLWKLKNGKC